MIGISEVAVKVLAEGLQASGVEPEKGLRLSEEGSNLTLGLDTPKENDRVVSQDGQSVLIINQELEERVGDALIDIEQTSEGPALIMRSVEKGKEQQE